METIWDSESGVNNGFRLDLDVRELYACSEELMSPEDYSSYVVVFGPIELNDIYDEGDRILVIWVTKRTLEIMKIPEIKTVRDMRTEHLGEYHDYLVVKRIKEARDQTYDYDSYDDYDDYDDYDGYSEGSHIQEFDLATGPKDVIDKLFVKEWKIVDEDEFSSYVIYGNDYKWWEKESFRKHFGRKGAMLLILVLF